MHKKLRAAKTNHERKALQRQIDAMNREFDQRVYELYGRTDKEIALVEEATGKSREPATRHWRSQWHTGKAEGGMGKAGVAPVGLGMLRG